MDIRINWITSVIFLAAGCAVFAASLSIPSGTSTTLGPAVVPRAVSLLMIGMALASLVWEWRAAQDADRPSKMTPRDLLFRAGPLIAMIAVYALLMVWFGYLAATILAGFAAFRLFGNGWRASALHAGLAGVLFYLGFIRLMGIYDPPGRLIDTMAWLN